MEQLKVKVKCPKLLSHRSIISDARATSKKKDLLPWPIKTRKRGSCSLALVSVESKEAPASASASESINPPPPLRSWSFTDLPPKKRILLAMRARRVDQTFMCVTCGRVFEDYHALGGHKSQHRKRQQGTSSSTDQTRRPQPQPHGEKTLALPWYDTIPTANAKEITTRFKVKM